MIIFFSNKVRIFLFLTLIILISSASFYWAFDFYFDGEDWWELWVISNPKLNYLIYKTDLFANHPISTFQQLLFFKFFGFNSYPWQILSYSLKVISSLAVVLMVWGMTNSKRAALYSGLIFAASVGGLESYLWIGRLSNVLILMFMAIGFYFWAKSFPGYLLSRRYIIACFFFLLAIFGDPGRGLITLALTIIWDVVTTIKYSKKNIIKIILRNSLFIFISLSLLLIFWRDHVFNSTSNNYQDWINYIVNNPLPVAKNFLTSLGNFISGGFVLTYDSGHLNVSEELALKASIIFIILTIILLITSFTKKSYFSKQMLFFCLWIPLAFFPSWFVVHYFYNPPLIAGVAHRYFTISEIGFVAALGYLLTKLGKRTSIILLTIIIFTNIVQSNLYLQQEWNNRSVAVIKPLWEMIDSQIPQEKDLSIIYFQGSNALTIALDSAEAIPFALKRNINNPEDVPVQSVVGWEPLERLLCEDGAPYVTPIRDSARAKKRIPLSRLYVWEVQNGIVVNVSGRERKKLFTELKCNFIY